LKTHNNIHLREEGKPFKKYVPPKKRKKVDADKKSLVEMLVTKTENLVELAMT
jgi:hypothetical protein